MQIEFELSAAVYATMALREVTREETSSWHQAGLTLSGEDQEFKGAAKVDEVTEEVKDVTSQTKDGAKDIDAVATTVTSTTNAADPVA